MLKTSGEIFVSLIPGVIAAGLCWIVEQVCMSASPNGAVMSMVYYGIGLIISYVMGFIITNAFVSKEETAQA